MFRLVIFLFSFSFLDAQMNVLAFSGSLQENSSNKKLILEAAEIVREEGANVKVIHLNDFLLPFYDADYEAKEGMPQKAKELRKLMIQSDVIMIASPEYNGSLTGVLKNMLDWMSRSEDAKSSREAFKGKKFILLSAAAGSKGGASGIVHLKDIIENIGGTVVPAQVLVPSCYQAFDAEGRFKDPKFKAEIKRAFHQAASGGSEHKIASGLPPEENPNFVPLS